MFIVIYHSNYGEKRLTGRRETVELKNTPRIPGKRSEE
jgi:hypothetical protein